jgi:hypothetical protein
MSSLGSIGTFVHENSYWIVEANSEHIGSMRMVHGIVSSGDMSKSRNGFAHERDSETSLKRSRTLFSGTLEDLMEH